MPQSYKYRTYSKYIKLIYYLCLVVPQKADETSETRKNGYKKP